MGSLALASAIGGTGQGMVGAVDLRSEKEERNLDREHDKMIQGMRDTAATGRIQQTADINLEQYERTQEDAMTALTEQREYDQSLIGATLAREDIVREDEQEHATDIEAMKQWQKRTESASYTSKDNKWEMKVLTQGEIGPNGLPVETDTFVVREPGTPFSYVQHGLTMLPHNYTDGERDAALAIANSGDPKIQEAKADLMSKAGTAQDDSSVFMDAYGYLPAAYFRKIRNTEEGSGSAYQKFRQSFRQPAASATSGDSGRSGGTAPTEFGQRVLDAETPENLNIDGIPYDQWMQENATGAPQPRGALSQAAAAAPVPTPPTNAPAPLPPTNAPPANVAPAPAARREPTGNVAEAIKLVMSDMGKSILRRLGIPHPGQQLTEAQALQLAEQIKAESQMRMGGRTY